MEEITPNADTPVPERKPVRAEFRRLDEVGLYGVRLLRGKRRIEGECYLGYDDRCDFVDRAIAALAGPDDDLTQLRREIEELLYRRRLSFEETCDHPELERMSESIVADVEWLWPGRIAADKLTMLVGDPGIGKSLVALDIAARVTTGRPWPDEPADAERRQPGGVLLLAETDDPADTIHPRLTALGADLDRVHLLRNFMQTGRRKVALPFSIAGNLHRLEHCIKKVPDCRLAIIDPLSIYVDGRLSRREVSEWLPYLIEVAVSQQVAILVVSHFSRGSQSLFHYGSLANSRFVAGARSVWKLVGDREHRDRRLLLPMKNNLGSDWLGLGFRIESVDDGCAPGISWEMKPLEITVERSVFEPDRPKLISSQTVQRELACEWLRSQLVAGAQLAQELFAAAREQQIGEKLLRRALHELGGVTRKGPTGRYVWKLPGDPSSGDSSANPTKLLQFDSETSAANQANLEPAPAGRGCEMFD